MFLISLCTLFSAIVLLAASDQRYRHTFLGLGFDQGWRYSVGSWFFPAFTAVLVLTSTMRYGFVDTYAYKEMYALSRNNLDYVRSAPWGVEAGWLYICYFLNFFSSSPKLMLFLSAWVIVGAYMKTFHRYSSNPVFSAYLFFCLLYMDTNNGLRQMVASAIVVMAFPLLTKKKFSNYFLYGVAILLARELHNSAIVCVMVIAAAYGKTLNIRTLGALLLGIVFLAAPGLVNSQIGGMFEDSKYLGYLNILGGGMSIPRGAVMGVLPAILAGLYYLKSKKNGVIIDQREALLLNILFINSMFVLMGLGMQYWARFAFYTNYAMLTLMPKLIKECFKGSTGRQVELLAKILYGVYFAYNIYVNHMSGALDKFYIEW